MILLNVIWRFSKFVSWIIRCRGVPYFIVGERFYLEGANPPSAFINVFGVTEKLQKNEGVNCVQDN